MELGEVAVGAGVSGGVFLLVFVVEAIVLGTRLSIALPVAVVVGLGFGALAFFRARSSTTGTGVDGR